MIKFKELPQHIYIHWPFCKSKCNYCDFISFQKHEGFQKVYHKALLDHIEHFCDINYTCKVDNEIKTIFFGGGSPSLYPLDLLEKLFSKLKLKFNLGSFQEITIEANPFDITHEKLMTWKILGINRLSLGVQILDDRVLKNLNRIQRIYDIKKTMQIAPKFFENISVDLILGLPGNTKEGWKKTLGEVVNWPINHLSVYILMVYKNTPLFHKIKNKELNILQDQDIFDLYKYTINFLKKYSFEQYELSNFAKSNFVSKHNIAYWNRKPYVGFGLSAASFDGEKRFVNEKNLIKYIDFCSRKDEFIINYQEFLTEKQRFLEELMLGLRLNNGVGLHRVLYSLSKDAKKKFLDGLKVLKSRELINEVGGKIFLTVKGMMLENEVILKLI
ncbi:radical SAM family heme chaperone HemW [Candidatus Dependentiae bacterium]|nr:radical SAM family heme chaperone HemW [Candidatus Dependentiae bacterium]